VGYILFRLALVHGGTGAAVPSLDHRLDDGLFDDVGDLVGLLVAWRQAEVLEYLNSHLFRVFA
jgi:predicted DNA-binding transcriptional regulator AlpA